MLVLPKQTSGNLQCVKVGFKTAIGEKRPL